MKELRENLFDLFNEDHLSLADAGGHFVGFAVAPADASLAVADDNHRGETEPATAFYDRSTALDLDDAVEQVALL